MPELVKLYIRSAVIGFVLSAVFVAMLLWFDVMGLRGLIMGTSGGLIGLFVMWVLNGIVFGSVQFGIAIMGMAEDEEDDDDKRGGTPIGQVQEDLVAIPVRADRRIGQQRQLRR